MRISMMLALVILCAGAVMAQEDSRKEERAPLGQATIALDARGAAALEVTLRTSALSGALDAPVTNVRIVIKNVTPSFLTYVSGLVTFYDGSGVRCGEGRFKVDSLAPGESAETDAPGLRVVCAPAAWRAVATDLLARGSGQNTAAEAAAPTNLIISIDGEEHPIQLGKPLILSLGDKRRSITIRTP